MICEVPVGRVPHPRYGFKDQSFDMKLLMLRVKGYLDAQLFNNRVVPKSYITMAEAGITKPCEYEFLPISENGISVEILKEHYPGFFYLGMLNTVKSLPNYGKGTIHTNVRSCGLMPTTRH
jgi:hypothetical protein